MNAETKDYITLTVESAEQGWIVKEKGVVTQVFFKWEWLVNYLKSKLSS